MKPAFHRIAAVAVVAFAALASVGAGDGTGDMSVNFDVGVHSYVTPAVAYQCTRDFQQCVRTIPDRAMFSPEAYVAERGGCCTSLDFCAAIVATMVAGNLEGDFSRIDDFKTAACSDETAEGARVALVASLLAMPGSK